MATKMNISKDAVNELMTKFLDSCISVLKEENSIGFQTFGAFEVVRREERISVHPQTKERSLVPPKLVLSFKQSSVLKEKINAKF